MQKLTIKSCLVRADELGIEIVGDAGFRGDCKQEDADLASFFAWVRFTYPQYVNFIFHAETEFNPTSATSYAYHAKSKAKGRLDGIADIICLPISKGAPAFMCELKRVDISKSLTSKKRKEHFYKQILILSSQQEAGNIAIVALGFESAKYAFIEYVEKWK
jgi:hypothetical protein